MPHHRYGLHRVLSGGCGPVWLRFGEVLAIHSAAMMMLAAPVSMAAGELFKFMTLFCWGISGCYWLRRNTCRRDPLIWLAAAVMILPMVGVLWSIAPAAIAVRRAFSYVGLSFLPVMLTLVTNRAQKSLVISFFNTGMVILFVLANLWWIAEKFGMSTMPLMDESHAAYSAYGTSAILAVFCLMFWIWHPFASRRVDWLTRIYPEPLLRAMIRAARMTPKTFLRRRQFPLARLLYLFRWSVVAGIAVYLFYITPSRSAILCALGVLAVRPICRFGVRGILIALGTLLLLFPILYVTSSTFSRRIDAVGSDLQSCDQLETMTFTEMASINSSGTRLYLLKNGFRAVADRPILGYGTGGTKFAYQAMTQKGGMHDPHCEYLMILLQWGSVGMTLFLALAIACTMRSRQIPAPFGHLAICTLVVTAIHSLTATPLSFGQTEFFLIVMLGTLLAPEKRH